MTTTNEGKKRERLCSNDPRQQHRTVEHTKEYVVEIQVQVVCTRWVLEVPLHGNNLTLLTLKLRFRSGIVFAYICVLHRPNVFSVLFGVRLKSCNHFGFTMLFDFPISKHFDCVCCQNAGDGRQKSSLLFAIRKMIRKKMHQKQKYAKPREPNGIENAKRETMKRGWWDERLRRIIQIVNGERIHISSVFRAQNAIDKKYVARFRLLLYSAVAGEWQRNENSTACVLCKRVETHSEATAMRENKKKLNRQ